MKKFSQLSTDINNIENISIEKIKDGEYEIESIIDIFLDPPSMNENTVSVNTDLSIKEIKRGEYIYITALLRKPGTTSFNSPAVQGVIKLRVVDIYYGLQYLNKTINRK